MVHALEVAVCHERSLAVLPVKCVLMLMLPELMQQQLCHCQQNLTAVCCGRGQKDALAVAQLADCCSDNEVKEAGFIIDDSTAVRGSPCGKSDQ